ncbi:MAG TPA: folate-binding protein [Marinobacter sp.]|nr:folate-binding protein [Marinobacter sp.]
MNNWTAFLQHLGAHITDAGQMLVDTPPATDATTLTWLGYRSIISLAGPDASRFLQGQITADVRQLSTHTVMGAQCNLKGRMIGSFRLVSLDPDNSQILLCSAAELAEALTASLKKYSVFSKVDINHCPDQWRLFGVAGSNACELIARHTGLSLAENDTSSHNEQLVVLRLDAEHYECWVKAEAAEALWQALAQEAYMADSGSWQLADIRRGSGHVYGATSELFTPQALNYDLTGAVSFKKGCYTGQEVVARLHYKGKPKKRMYRIGFAADSAPLPGTALTDADGKVQGLLVMAAMAAPGRAEALAELPINSAINSTSHAQNDLFFAQTQVVERLPLPYTLPEDDNNP